MALSQPPRSIAESAATCFSAADSPGMEWVVDAFGCREDAARSIDTLNRLATLLIRDLELHPAAPPLWRSFDGGGVTGLFLLTESHLTCHTFPESGFIALNLYCCRQRAAWPWEQHLTELFGATRVQVRELARG